MPLSVNVHEKQSGSYVVSPVGSIDSLTYVDLEQAVDPVLASSPRVVVLNFSGVDYVSSRGISVIFKIKKAVEGGGGSFLMTDLQPQIKKVFEIIRALPSMNIFSSEEEADAYLAEMQRRALEGGEEA